MSVQQLSQLLPLPTGELQQVLDYALTLSMPEAAEHFGNLLGDSPQAIEFISSFNARRSDGPSSTSKPAGASSSSAPAPQSSSAAASGAPEAVPKAKRHQPKKKKAAIHTPEARKVDGFVAPAGMTYSKKDLDLDYIPQQQRQGGGSAPGSNEPSRSNTPKPPPQQQPKTKPPPKQHASSTGFLISDAPSKSKPKPSSNPVSRTSTPKPTAGSSTTKVSISGGTPMAGASAAIADLDAAIRALEITTNPTLDNPKARKCNCVATRHPLQGAAPNCLSCGKVICMKEGLGPCTFCGTPLLGNDDVQAMMRELRDERGRERMAADRQAHRRPEVSKAPAPFSQPRTSAATTTTTTTTTTGNEDGTDDAEAKARAHRDKLLGFQAQNAQRTTVRDEAADFDATRGGSMWARPEERARELKRQQKLLREMEWNARPEYEKRQQVVSIDLVGGKVIRKMAPIERPVTPPEEEEKDEGDGHGDGAALRETTGNRQGGAFSGNPLLGALIRPVFDAKGKGAEVEGREQRRKKGWQRVQHDLDNNEGVILDGGVYGGGTSSNATGDEPARG